jgi:hypothetical protein
MKNMKRKLQIFTYSLVASIFSIGVGEVSAQQGNLGVKITSPLEKLNIQDIITAVLSFIVKVGTVIAVFFVIYSGFLFVTAQGDESKISKAKTTLFGVVIGALILIGAEVLSEVICNTANQLGAGASCSR